MDINALDEDEFSPLGYVLNDNLWKDYKGSSQEVTTVYNGCQEAYQLLNTIEFLVANGAKCIYNGEEHSSCWTNQYLKTLKNS